MKRLLAFAVAVLLTFSFSACAVKESEMYIEKAILSEEEKEINELYDEKQYIYDFAVDDSIKSVQINTYELDGAQWKLIAGGGGCAFDETEGRLALDFEKIPEGMKTVLQSEKSKFSDSYGNKGIEEIENMGCATSFLNERTDIEYEKEIPLAVQIITDKNEIHSYEVEYFNNPEEYEKHNYEYVYAVTVRFSQKTVGELSEIR